MAILTRIVIFVLLLTITIPYLVLSYPDGAGTCDPSQMLTQGHKTPIATGVGGYSLSVSNGTTSGSFSISVNGPKSIKGLLIFTQDSKGTRTGNFVIPSNLQSKDCGGSGTNSLTHQNSNAKSMPIKLSWSPLSGSSDTSTTVKALVVVSFSDWYQLNDLTFDTASGAVDNSTTSTPPSTSTSDSGSSSGSGSGSNFFQQYTLFVVIIIITAVLYVVGCLVETALKRQQIKARAFAKAVGGFGQ